MLEFQFNDVITRFIKGDICGGLSAENLSEFRRQRQVTMTANNIIRVVFCSL